MDKGNNYFRFPTGLRNLGNTCFMNSALQCLASVQPLADLFAQKPQINNSNSNAAEVVKAVEEFFKAKRHQTSSMVYSPYLIKSAIGRVSKRFEGYDQQDAFELMTVLLNALADGLNKVIGPVKLGPEDPNYQKMLTEEKFAYSEDRFKERQNSEIVDLFYGFHKNVIKCQNANCNIERERFQPYAFLSVPIYRTSFIIHCIDEKNCYIYQKGDGAGGWNSPIASFKYRFQLEKTLSDVEKDIFAELNRKEGTGHFYILQRDNSLSLLQSNFVDEIPSGGILIFHITTSIGTSHKVIRGQRFTYQQSSSWNKKIIKVLEFQIGENTHFGPHYFQDVSTITTLEHPSETGGTIYYEYSGEIRLPETNWKSLVSGKMSDEMSLEECLKLFINPSLLSEDSSWTCSECKQDPGVCTFQTQIWTVPQVLVIHLRRFKAVENYGFMRMEKINSLVTYPSVLDMKPYLAKALDGKEYQYSLVSVSRHHGSLMGGHYNANAFDGNKWYHYDDSYVHETRLKDVLNDSAALFLIYVCNSIGSAENFTSTQ